MFEFAFFCYCVVEEREGRDMLSREKEKKNNNNNNKLLFGLDLD